MPLLGQTSGIWLHPALLGGATTVAPWGIHPKDLGLRYALDVLLHEMMHVAVQELYGGHSGSSSHNCREWIAECNRIAPMLGFEGLTAGLSKQAALPDDSSVLWSRSWAHKAPYHAWPDAVLARILDIRDHPPEGLRRVPGPRAILYYLHRDSQFGEQAVDLPRSTRTVWRILERNSTAVRATSAAWRGASPR